MVPPLLRITLDVEWSKQPRTRSRVRHAYHRRAFPSKLPVYLDSPCGECFERNTTSMGPVPICSRGSHGDQRLHSLMEGDSRPIQRARRRKGDSISERGSFHKKLVLLCRDKYDKLFACMYISASRDANWVNIPGLGTKLERVSSAWWPA